VSDPTRARVYDDPEWKYTPANNTQIRERFDRIRREMKQQEQAKASTVFCEGASVIECYRHFRKDCSLTRLQALRKTLWAWM
jgi:hypothetical protein